MSKFRLSGLGFGDSVKINDVEKSDGLYQLIKKDFDRYFNKERRLILLEEDLLNSYNVDMCDLFNIAKRFSTPIVNKQPQWVSIGMKTDRRLNLSHTTNKWSEIERTGVLKPFCRSNKSLLNQFGEGLYGYLKESCYNYLFPLDEDYEDYDDYYIRDTALIEFTTNSPSIITLVDVDSKEGEVISCDTVSLRDATTIITEYNTVKDYVEGERCKFSEDREGRVIKDVFRIPQSILIQSPKDIMEYLSELHHRLNY